MKPKTVTTVHTDETPATAPARRDALQMIANLSDRQLAFFHWREASEALSALEHKIRDYGDETSAFDSDDAKDIQEKLTTIDVTLGHVLAIAAESAERTRAETARIAAEKGGAS